jgi:hypothetical protein
MQKTMGRTVRADRREPPKPPSWDRKWASIAAVVVLGSAMGFGLSVVSGGDMTPQEIAQIRAEQTAEFRASQWAAENAPTPQEIAALRFAQYPEAHRRIWESQQP